MFPTLTRLAVILFSNNTAEMRQILSDWGKKYPSSSPHHDYVVYRIARHIRCTYTALTALRYLLENPYNPTGQTRFDEAAYEVYLLEYDALQRGSATFFDSEDSFLSSVSTLPAGPRLQNFIRAWTRARDSTM